MLQMVKPAADAGWQQPATGNIAQKTAQVNGFDNDI